MDKRLTQYDDIDALKVRSINNLWIFTGVSNDHCARCYFRCKDVQWHGIVQCVLGWGERYYSFDGRTKQKRHG